MKRKPNPMDQILRQATQPQQQEGNRLYIVKNNDDREYLIIEKRRELRLDKDPISGMVMPVTISRHIYSPDSNGNPVQHVTQIGFCNFGCMSNNSYLFVCRHCHENVCQKHLFIVNKRIYCKKRGCQFFGRIYQVSHFVYRIISFCLGSVLGLDRSTEGHRSEEDFFPLANRE